LANGGTLGHIPGGNSRPAELTDPRHPRHMRDAIRRDSAPTTTFVSRLADVLADASTARSGASDAQWNASRTSPQVRNSAVTPISLRVPPRMLRDLGSRLAGVRWSGGVDDTPWADGTDVEFLRSLVDYWRRGYDWRAQERAINAMPHFRADLGDARIHFVHIRGSGRNSTPLLMCHGWPSTFLEYRKVIPLLTEPTRHGGPDGDTYDIVIPSLPGYGFSDAPRTPGVHVGSIAQLYDRLMTDVLGYERYAAHGSDIGANVVSWLGLDVPEHLYGAHLTSVTGSAMLRDLTNRSRPLSEAEEVFLADVAQWGEHEGGYSHVQRTKPRSLAYALTDSPVGLAAWIVEKYHAWSDCGGDVTRQFTFDELLTTIMIYWITGSIGPSMRLYYEGYRHPRRLAPGERVEVPCGVALFPHDLARPPREWGERAYRIARWTEMPRGGHFPAHEEPELLAEDIREFFGPLRNGGRA
jgi:pimeloyl-ACP methyl ester carboxylesterase